MTDALEAMAASIAELRAEVLVNRVLATLALDWLVSTSPDPKGSVDALSLEIDQHLTLTRFRDGDEDENERMREYARNRAQDVIASLARRAAARRG